VGRFRVVEATASGPQPVHVTVGVEAGLPDDAGAYLATAVRVIEDFGRRFGPYPWPAYTLSIAPALKGGIEYPSHVMQGPGSGGRTTPHEIGHQWFYGLVPTNQGATPWIDEGMATYAESRFEDTLQKFKTTAIPADGRGKAGEPMTYWEPRQSIYYRSVYVQGAQAIAALGPPDQVDCALRQLVARQAYHLTGNGEVVAALTTVFPNAAEVLGRYGISP
jgi:aminopeptidase N